MIAYDSRTLKGYARVLFADHSIKLLFPEETDRMVKDLHAGHNPPKWQK